MSDAFILHLLICRFCLPGVIQVSREADSMMLQKEILSQLGDAVKPEVFSQVGSLEKTVCVLSRCF